MSVRGWDGRSLVVLISFVFVLLRGLFLVLCLRTSVGSRGMMGVYEAGRGGGRGRVGCCSGS